MEMNYLSIQGSSLKKGVNRYGNESYDADNEAIIWAT